MTIYQIKRLTQESSPYFFDRKSLRFFGQTMRSFRVCKQSDGRYKITAPITHKFGAHGETVRFFNPLTNQLDRE